MDEPTAALTDREIETLFTVINKLRKEGVSFVYISHRMEEIFQYVMPLRFYVMENT